MFFTRLRLILKRIRFNCVKKFANLSNCDLLFQLKKYLNVKTPQGQIKTRKSIFKIQQSQRFFIFYKFIFSWQLRMELINHKWICDMWCKLWYMKSFSMTDYIQRNIKVFRQNEIPNVSKLRRQLWWELCKLLIPTLTFQLRSYAWMCISFLSNISRHTERFKRL